MPRFSEEDLARIKERKRALARLQPPEPWMPYGTAVFLAAMILWLAGYFHPILWDISAAVEESVRLLFKTVTTAFAPAVFIGFVSVFLWRPRKTKKVWPYVAMAGLYLFWMWILLKSGIGGAGHFIAIAAMAVSIIALGSLFTFLVLEPIRRQTRFGKWAAKNPVIREYFPESMPHIEKDQISAPPAPRSS